VDPLVAAAVAVAALLQDRWHVALHPCHHGQHRDLSPFL